MEDKVFMEKLLKKFINEMKRVPTIYDKILVKTNDTEKTNEIEIGKYYHVEYEAKISIKRKRIVDFDEKIFTKPLKKIRRKTWLESFVNLQDFISENYDYPTYTTDSNLARWIGLQKYKYKKGILSEDKMKYLISLPNWSWEKRSK